MKFWILTILRLGGKLCALADALDKRAEDLALNMRTDTFTLYDSILKLNDKKVKVVNMKVMLDAMIAGLDGEECGLLTAYSHGDTLEKIASATGVCRSTVLRRLNRIIKKCSAVLARLGFCEKLLEYEYRDFAPVYVTYAKLKRNYIVKMEAAKGIGCRARSGSKVFEGSDAAAF